MIRYLNLRIVRLQSVVSILLLVIISMLHTLFMNNMFESLDIIEYSPYSKWILVESYSGLGILYLLIMPLVISIGVSDIYIQDKKQNLQLNIYLYYSRLHSNLIYLLHSSIVSFLIATIPLFIGFISLFMVFPDIIPDKSFSQLIGVTSFNTLFSSLFYGHPFVFIFIYSMLVGVWASVMNVMAISLSIYFNKRIYAIIGPFLFQILLIIIGDISGNSFIVAPVYFLLAATPFVLLKTSIIILTFVLYILLSMYFFIKGTKNYELD